MEWICCLALLVPGAGPLPRPSVPPLMDAAQARGFAMRAVVAPPVTWQGKVPRMPVPLDFGRFSVQAGAISRAYLASIDARVFVFSSEADARFEQLQAQADAIRQSDQPESRKREQLARLVSPGMTAEQVAILLGTQQQILCYENKVGYLALGCTLELESGLVRRVILERDADGRLTCGSVWLVIPSDVYPVWSFGRSDYLAW